MQVILASASDTSLYIDITKELHYWWHDAIRTFCRDTSDIEFSSTILKSSLVVLAK
jgi:hypothetical protein